MDLLHREKAAAAGAGQLGGTTGGVPDHGSWGQALVFSFHGQALGSPEAPVTCSLVPTQKAWLTSSWGTSHTDTRPTEPTDRAE